MTDEMKYSKERPKSNEEVRARIAASISNPEDRLSLSVSCIGIMKLLGDYIVKNCDPKKLDPQTKYGMAMSYHYLQMMQLIANGELKQEDKVEFGHMPCDEGAWQNDEDFNKRSLLVIKHLYEDCVRRGLIKRKNFTITDAKS